MRFVAPGLYPAIPCPTQGVRIYNKIYKGDARVTKENKYEFIDDHVIGYTNRHHNKFFFDKEDFEIVSKHYWILDSDRNVFTQTENGKLTMHKLLMGDGIYYHENGNNSDNRKSNIKSARGHRNDGKIKYNGYISVYMPEHHRAFDNGCVYEHILVAEKMLERLLLPDEVVHHKDRDRTNNSENNLMVFASEEDHALYHAGAEIILQENGSYKSERIYQVYHQFVDEAKDGDGVETIKMKKKILYKDLCSFCNTHYKSITSEMCVECYKNKRVEHIPPKEELEKLIGKMSFVKIGEMYGVSDNAVRKWCLRYDLPFRIKDLKQAI